MGPRVSVHRSDEMINLFELIKKFSNYSQHFYTTKVEVKDEAKGFT